MKGVSLSIETIVILILAVIVLAAMLVFFSGTTNPAADTLRATRMQTESCAAYVRKDPDCTDIGINDVPPDVKQKIAEACNILQGYDECRGQPPTNIACVRSCCKTFCGGDQT